MAKKGAEKIEIEGFKLHSTTQQKLRGWLVDAKKIGLEKDEVFKMFTKVWKKPSLKVVLEGMGGKDNEEAQLFAVDALGLDITTAANIELEEFTFLVIHNTIDRNAQDYDEDIKKYTGDAYPKSMIVGLTQFEDAEKLMIITAKREHAQALEELEEGKIYNGKFNRWSKDDATRVGCNVTTGTDIVNIEDTKAEIPKYTDPLAFFEANFVKASLAEIARIAALPDDHKDKGKLKDLLSKERGDARLIIGDVLHSRAISSKGRAFGRIFMKDDSFTFDNMENSRKLLLSVMCNPSDVKRIGRYSKVAMVGDLTWKDEFGASLNKLIIYPIRLVAPMKQKAEEDDDDSADARDYYQDKNVPDKKVIRKEEEKAMPDEGKGLNPEGCPEFEKGYDADDEGCKDCKKQYPDTADHCEAATKSPKA